MPYRRPFDWDALLGFLAPRAIPGVEAVADRTYRRTCVVGGEVALLEVAPGKDGVLVLRLAGAAGSQLLAMTSRVRRIFDLDADPLAVAERLRRDPLLAKLVRPGLRVPGAWNAFELAVRAVLGQQVSVRGATTLAGRLVGALGRPLPRAWAKLGARSGLSHVFPEATELADADLTTLGLTRARAQTIRALARQVAAGELSLDQGVDLETSLARLQQVPGIGPWTAHYIAMRAFGEPDAFPAGDLGLRRTVARLRDRRMPTAKALETLAERWRPWRAYAAMQLWTVAGTGQT
jgi:AraC family transcriptional regulator of adaptative response / DNA-3-methyladenine glycosylase II